VSLRRQAAFWFVALAVFVLFLWLFRDILLPFILGMALAYFLDPVADRLERLGLSRLVATIAIVIAAVLVFVLALVLLVPALLAQLASFLDRLPAYVSRLQQLALSLLDTRVGHALAPEGAGVALDGLVRQGVAWVGTVAGSLWAGGRALVGVVSIMVVTPVVAFYLLYDWDRMLAQADAWIPRDHLAEIRALAAEVNAAMSGYIRGQAAVCVILGVFYALALTLVGLNFGLLIGVVTGLISFVPFVGSIIGFVLAVGLALVQFWPSWPWVLAVIVIFAVGQFVEGNILQPRLVGASVGVHPVWLMFALFAFGSLFGFVGLLLAVPLAAAVAVLMRFIARRYRASALYLGKGPREPDLFLPPE